MKKEVNVLFNDIRNTFYVQLYVVGHVVEIHSGSERKNLLLPHGLLFLISSKGFFYMHHPIDGIVYILLIGMRTNFTGSTEGLIQRPIVAQRVDVLPMVYFRLPGCHLQYYHSLVKAVTCYLKLFHLAVELRVIYAL